PSWIKNNAGWWADGTIDDDSFVSGIEYLIKENILHISSNFVESTSDEIPSWIKNNAGWWADGTIDDDSFVSGIEYLVNNGIISVN
ncbi:MAG: peptidase, partial [Nitrosopumilus sp.]|nr:peptidase [Nitrosopumilus sp.]MBT4299075.1 peptidase [Nitrosopumilus sp.]